jgi:hypothetical protein
VFYRKSVTNSPNRCLNPHTQKEMEKRKEVHTRRHIQPDPKTDNQTTRHTTRHTAKSLACTQTQKQHKTQYTFSSLVCRKQDCAQLSVLSSICAYLASNQFSWRALFKTTSAQLLSLRACPAFSQVVWHAFLKQPSPISFNCARVLLLTKFPGAPSKNNQGPFPTTGNVLLSTRAPGASF